MKDYVETINGKAYFKNNLRHGDKLEISSWMNAIREQLAKCMNTWYRSTNSDEAHEKLYSQSLEELQDIQKTVVKVEKLLKEYINKKQEDIYIGISQCFGICIMYGLCIIRSLSINR